MTKSSKNQKVPMSFIQKVAWSFFEDGKPKVEAPKFSKETGKVKIRRLKEK